MSSELSLLAAALQSRKAFQSVRNHLDPVKDLSTLGGTLWGYVADYYETDPDCKRCDVAILVARINRAPALHKHAEELTGILDAAGRLDTGGMNAVADLIETQRLAAGNRLAAGLGAGRSAKDVDSLLEAYTALHGAHRASGGISEKTMYDIGLDDIAGEMRSTGARLQLLPKLLNAYIRGGVLPGHCVVVYGRVNVGKSLVVLNMAAGMLKQGRTVLYLDYEDNLADTLFRMGCRLAMCVPDWAEANPARFKEIAASRGIARFLLPSNPPSTAGQVERAIEQYKPDVVIVNQISNLAGSSEQTASMDALAHAFRAVGKRNGVVMILVARAKEGEDNHGNVREKAILQMADCYGSRTGIPGAADLMIGVGTNEALKASGMICLSVPKNKLGRGKDGTAEPVLYMTMDTERNTVGDV